MKKMSTDNQDIIELILEDHKSMKQLIEILKDNEKDAMERQQAFDEFAILLTAHAKPEEQVLYTAMKSDEDMREEALEGDVEHGLADQLLEETKRTDDRDLWSARVKVLAEVVEHHIEEEEQELLPEFRKHSESAQRIQLGKEFLRLKSAMLSMGGVDSPSEDSEEKTQYVQ